MNNGKQRLTDKDFDAIAIATVSHSIQELFRCCKLRTELERRKYNDEYSYLFDDEYNSPLPFPDLLTSKGIDVEYARNLIRQLVEQARKRRGSIGFNLFFSALRRLGLSYHQQQARTSDEV